MMLSLKENLNPAQLEAVTNTEGALMVFAGAGSGKTRVIIYRIIYLLKNSGLNPDSIFAATFTNKAAGVMRERISKTTNKVPHWLGTFHSLGARILRREFRHFDRQTDFIIFDEKDQLDMIKKILTEIKANTTIMTPKTAAYFINRIKDNAPIEIDFKEICGDAIGNYVELLENIWNRYQAALVRENAVDFADLIYIPVKLFRQFPDVLNTYASCFKYVLVDEFQDTNKAQYLLVKSLASVHKNICVVGDEDQCIYEWRGANYKNIINFMTDFPDVKKIKLETNYRSVGNILDVANRLIRNNTERSDKVLKPFRGHDGTPPLIISFDDADKEAEYVADSIIKWHREYNVSFKDIAVFYRLNSQSRLLEAALARQGIPFKIIGGTGFYERKEIKDIIAYLRVLANTSSDLSLMRIINVPERGIGKKTIDVFYDFSRKQGLSLYDALRHIETANFKPCLVKKLADFRKMFYCLKESSLDMSVSDTINKIINLTGYIKNLEEKGTEDDLRRVDNVQELLNAACDFEESHTDSQTVKDFLEHIALLSDVDYYDESGEYVSLMTLHTAKGLEFRAVAVTGVEQGILPHIRSGEDSRSLEEERRLLYVGITRAKDYLQILYARSRRIYGTYYYHQPSIFIDEIRAEATRGVNVNILQEKKVCSKGLRVGRRVRHQRFGYGKILKLIGTAETASVNVLFSDGNRRMLMLKYANLELL